MHWYLLAHVLRVCQLYFSLVLTPYSINWICWVMLSPFFTDLAGGIYGNYKLWRIFDFSSCSGLKNRDSWKMIWTDIGKPHDQNIPSLNVTSRTYSSFDGKFHLVNVLLRLNVLMGSSFHFYSWKMYVSGILLSLLKPWQNKRG